LLFPLQRLVDQIGRAVVGLLRFLPLLTTLGVLPLRVLPDEQSD
jgi:hypothetical protein